MDQWLSESSPQQRVRILQHHEQGYHHIKQFIEKSPGNLRIFEILPPKPLDSNGLGSRLTSLNQRYHLGRRSGSYLLATAGHWLMEQEKLNGVKFKKALSVRLNQPKNVRMPSPIISDVSLSHDLTVQPEVNWAKLKTILPGDLPPSDGGMR